MFLLSLWFVGELWIFQKKRFSKNSLPHLCREQIWFCLVTQPKTGDRRKGGRCTCLFLFSSSSSSLKLFYATKSTTEYFQKILERPPKKQRLLSRCIFTLTFNSHSLLLWMSEDSNLPGVKVFSLAPVQPRTCLNRCPSQTVQRNTMECFQP